MATILERIFARPRQNETRASGSIESAKVPISSASILEYFGISSKSVIVTEEKALGLPPVFAAVNFLSRAMATLPLHVYSDGKSGRSREGGAVAALLNGAANDEMTSYALRKWFWDRVFTKGRGLLLIERDASGKPSNLLPLDPDKTSLLRVDFQTTYEFKDGKSLRKIPAVDVIDVAFMHRPDALGVYGPLATCRDRLAQMISANGYGSKVFEKGGLPHFAIEGPFSTPEGMNRAAKDLAAAAAEAYNEGRPALALPAQHKLTPIGVEPQKMQMVEFQHFLIEEVARIYQIPPVFLQHLLNNTYSNAEQQDLQLVKHVILGWSAALEAELNLKLFGRKNGTTSGRRFYTSHNVDGLLRGDFAARMEGLSKSVQNAILTPNEARALENREPLPNGDKLYIQGATVELGTNLAGGNPAPPAAE